MARETGGLFYDRNRNQRNHPETNAAISIHGATLPVEKRLEALKKLKVCIQKYEPLINEALKRDLGKSNFETDMCATGLVLSELSYMIRHTPSYAKEKTVRTPIAQFASQKL